GCNDLGHDVPLHDGGQGNCRLSTAPPPRPSTATCVPIRTRPPRSGKNHGKSASSFPGRPICVWGKSPDRVSARGGWFDLGQCNLFGVVLSFGADCHANRVAVSGPRIDFDELLLPRRDHASSGRIEGPVTAQGEMHLLRSRRPGHPERPLGVLHHETGWRAWDASLLRAATGGSGNFQEGADPATAPSGAGGPSPTRTQAGGAPANVLFPDRPRSGAEEGSRRPARARRTLAA